jgi:hypothetical protein
MRITTLFCSLSLMPRLISCASHSIARGRFGPNPFAGRFSRVGKERLKASSGAPQCGDREHSGWSSFGPGRPSAHSMNKRWDP